MIDPEALERPSFRALAAASFRIGVLGFGGPAGQIVLMHRIFVEEKKWIDEPRYLHALNYCMLLPGPEAQQLATYVGWLLHGVRGGVVSGALFVLPGAFVVLGLSWLYVAHSDAPWIGPLFYGVKAAVVALVVEAMIRIAGRALKRRLDIAIAAATFLLLYLFNAPFPLVIAAAAAVGFFNAGSAPGPPEAVGTAMPGVAESLRAACTWGALWLAPVVLAFSVLGSRHVLTEVGLLFSQLAVVTFGGAYAVLAYLQQQAVEVHGWLTPAQMIDGLGLAETTPGPLILVNQFVGYVAGWHAAGGGAGLALAGAAMASWCTFAPAYLWIFAGAPFAERLRTSRVAAGALAAITAAVLGVIANLALWFGMHVLFGHVNTLATPWGRALPIPDIASLDVFAVAISVAAAVALARFRINILLVIFACTIAGIARFAAP